MQPLKVVTSNSSVYNSSNNKPEKSKMEIKPVNPDRALRSKISRESTER